MANVTVSIPDDLKKEMERVGGVNWKLKGLWKGLRVDDGDVEAAKKVHLQAFDLLDKLFFK